MTQVLPKLTEAAWGLLPGPLRRKLRTGGGRRLVRFAPAALAALLATQLTYLVLQIAHVSAGIAGAAGWFAGASVSYVVSRWAWERKGRPHLLKETLPFWLISLGVGVVLTLTSKFAHAEARHLGLHRVEEVIFAQGLYLAANCVTFVVRFLIFHYVLFADRESGDSEEPADRVSAPEGAEPATVTPSANRSPAPAAGTPAEPSAPRTRR
jgi:putative flippase GtrA